MSSPALPSTLARIGRKLQSPAADAMPWGAPPIPELIERIDAALKLRGRA